MQDQRPLSPATDILSDHPGDPDAISSPTLYEMLMSRYEQEERIDKVMILSSFIAIVMEYGPDDDLLDPDEGDETAWNERTQQIFHVEPDYHRN